MNTFRRPPLWLLILLITFPQLVETICDPASPDIAISFHVSSERVAQTPSIYSIAFAVGVTMWGWLSDCIEQRRMMPTGLICYETGCAAAVVANDFSVLLLAWMISAIGTAVGSVVVQAILRDCYGSTALSHIFLVMGAVLALSSVFGLLNEGWLVSLYGHTGVFVALVLLALLLPILTAAMLPETRPEHTLNPKLTGLLSRMVRDNGLRGNALLVVLPNTMLFSYYGLAPLLFGQLEWGSRAFGQVGLLPVFASLSGSLLNRRLLTTGLTPGRLACYACVLAALSGLVARCLQHSAWILIPMFGVVTAYGIAIPSVLSQVPRHYREQVDTAGTLFGLSYHLLLGMMLSLADVVQQLGLALNVYTLLAWLCNLGRRQTR